MNELLNTLQEQFDKMHAEIDRLKQDKIDLAQQLFAEQTKQIDTQNEMLGKTEMCKKVHVVAECNQISEERLWLKLSMSITCEDLEKLISITNLPDLTHEDNI